jgi:hypothetical protein
VFVSERVTPFSTRGFLAARHLPKAIRQLDDQELDQLLSAVIAEQKRRGKNLTAVSRKQGVDVAAAVAIRPFCPTSADGLQRT